MRLSAVVELAEVHGGHRSGPDCAGELLDGAERSAGASCLAFAQVADGDLEDGAEARTGAEAEDQKRRSERPLVEACPTEVDREPEAGRANQRDGEADEDQPAAERFDGRLAEEAATMIPPTIGIVAREACDGLRPRPNCR